MCLPLASGADTSALVQGSGPFPFTLLHFPFSPFSSFPYPSSHPFPILPSSSFPSIFFPFPLGLHSLPGKGHRAPCPDAVL